MPNVDFTTGGYTVRLNITDVTSIENNTSTLTVQPLTSGTNTYNERWWMDGSITINGVAHNYSSSSGSVSVTLSANNTFFNWKRSGNNESFTQVVEHDSEGKKTIPVVVNITGNRSWTERYWDSNTEEWDTVTKYAHFTVTGSTNLTLETIPRATIPTLSKTSTNFNSAVTVNLPRKSSSFTHKIYYSFGSLKNQTGGLSASTNVGTSATFTPPNSLMNQIPNATEGNCTIYVETYNGTEKIGSTQTVVLKLTVASGIKPTVSGITTSDLVTGLNTKFHGFVQTKSNVQISVSASGTYSSTIANYNIKVGSNMVFTSNPCSTGTINLVGTVPVVVTVTDSRGRTATGNYSFTVIPYERPHINSFQAYRIDTSGNTDEEGTRLGAKLNYNVASVNGYNDKTYIIKYRLSTATTFSNVGSGTAQTTFDDVLKYTSSPNLSTNSAYVIRFELSDYFETVYAEYQISTAYTILDFKENGLGVAVGKVCEGDRFEVGMRSYFSKQIEVAKDEGTYNSATELNALIDRLVPDDVYGKFELSAYVSVNAGILYHNSFFTIYTTDSGIRIAEAIDEHLDLWKCIRNAEGVWGTWSKISSGGASYQDVDGVKF